MYNTNTRPYRRNSSKKKGRIMQYVNLKETRKKLGMSLKTVADGVGVSISTIINWEKNNSLTSLYKRDMLAEIYHIEPDTIQLCDTDKTSRLIQSGIRKLRKEKGLTISQVAEHLGTSTNQVSRWETFPGTGISSANAIKLGELYDVPGYRIEELMKKYQDEIKAYETHNTVKEK